MKDVASSTDYKKRWRRKRRKGNGRPTDCYMAKGIMFGPGGGTDLERGYGDVRP